MPAVTVFGAVAMDVRLHAAVALVAGTSNPVTARKTPGGVGRNVAAVLARLGGRVSLVSRLGDDAAGNALAADLDAMGIDRTFVQRPPGAASACYWAVLEPTGDLALGLADMVVIETLTPADLDPAIQHPADGWFIDANLPEACIAHLLDHPARPPLVAVDTVSVSKARRLWGRLGKVDLLITNDAEAVVLCGAADAARLVASGARAVVMGRGAAGLDLADASGRVQLDPLPVTPRDVTGAGDAMAAATLFASLCGLELPAAARIGRLAAALAISGESAVDNAGLREAALRFDTTAHADLARLQS